MKLKSFAKTSGSKGLQIYVPLNTSVTYDQTKDLSRSLAQYLEREHSNLVTSNMSKSVRKAKCSSIGARTTNTRQPFAFIRSAPGDEPTVSAP
jgi:bifunctional non-homologous end joining protein LigD